LRDFPSEIVEKDNKPEVELQGYNARTKALVLAPIYLARSEKEKCLIEPSINSTRVTLAFFIVYRSVFPSKPTMNSIPS